MTQKKIITGESVEEALRLIDVDFSHQTSSDHHSTIQIGEKSIDIDMVSSPGGSYEGGYDTTKFTAPLHTNSNFLFAIHPEDFLNKIGKLFGMQDVTTGYPEFDAMVIVKTNDTEFFKKVFADNELRLVIQSLSGYSFSIIDEHERGGKHLELFMQRAIRTSEEFHSLFNIFYNVLTSIEAHG